MGDAPLRLFLALRLPGEALDRIDRWAGVELRGCRAADGCRRLSCDQIHVTLAFLGRRPGVEVDPILEVLQHCAGAARPIRLEPRGWRETRSVGMLVFADEGGAATALAAAVQGGLEELGVYRRERRPWLPHLTLCRFRRPPGLRPSSLPVGTCVPSEAAAYVSHLHPAGARYEVLQAVTLMSR